MQEVELLRESAAYVFQTSKDELSRHEILNEFKRHLSLPTQRNIMTIAKAFVEKVRQEGMRKLFIKLLGRCFPNQVTSNHFELIGEADNDSLFLWGEKLINADSIEEVFIW